MYLIYLYFGNDGENGIDKRALIGKYLVYILFHKKLLLKINFSTRTIVLLFKNKIYNYIQINMI